ncbi:AI-2E family transporter [Algoriphagus sp. CAU 1675]|uniref:AI-2E family transporter n=1 Tax=Algoriphagus sp. CAU 1675 TaxID=3032597 RepID=UPI0023DB5A4D|nr:AI-2E family transporter [Algoriphagus sp. CAU 1675]MDF2157055.1 AI-2E family transporter [Algoriphagus sp. CAU 1675]
MNSLQKTAYFLVILVFGSLVLKEGSFILVPMVWGVFFAFSLNPISNWFEKRRFPRGVAIVISILIVTLIAVGIFYLLLNQMVGLIRDVPEIGEKLQEKLSIYMDEASLLLGENWRDPAHKLEVWSILKLENLDETLFSTGKSLTLAGIIPLYIFLMMYYKDFFMAFLLKLSADSNEKVLLWVGDSGHIIQSYLSGMLRVTGIMVVLAGLFFYSIGVKYFLLFGVFIAVMNLIPYVGVVISSFFAILYVFLTTDSMVYPLLTFVVLWGIQLLENNIITPWIVGSQVKVNALAVILAILLGGWLWGISGMVLFIPMVGVLKITLERSYGLEAFGYLLSDDVPVNEEKENYLKLFLKKIKRKKIN